MTFAARIVLEDLKQAAAMFEPGLQGSEWRIVYPANVALLRAVYHVLKNRDAKDQRFKSIFNTWNDNLRKSMPEPKIYW